MLQKVKGQTTKNMQLTHSQIPISVSVSTDPYFIIYVALVKDMMLRLYAILKRALEEVRLSPRHGVDGQGS